eukprot:scaffold409_cov167-Ochromonas_danica.AAC.11
MENDHGWQGLESHEEYEYDSHHPLSAADRSSGSVAGANGGISGIRISMDDSMMDAYRDGPDTYPTLKRANSFSNLSRKSLDDAYYADPRIQRLLQTEATIRQEMFKECTFRPKIKDLPNHYGPLKETGTPFVTRMKKWKETKEHELRMKENLTKKVEEEQCSFKPNINKLSKRAIQELRGSSPESAHERLYRSSNVIEENRTKLIEEESMRELRNFETECTFKPQLVTKSNPLFQQVQPKFHRTPSAKKNDTSTLTIQNKDCTFTPQVNKVKAHMNSAKQYLQTNVVERLSRPVVSGDGGINREDGMGQMFDDSFNLREPGNVIDAATFIGALQGSAEGRPSTSPHPYLFSANKSQVSASSNGLAKEEKKIRQERLESFLRRQESMLEKKKKSIEQLEKHTTPAFKPEVSRVAKRLTRDQFMKRVERDIEQRTTREQLKEIEATKEFSFRPAINRKAGSMRSRSVFEMSRGDALRKEANNRMLKLKADQEQLANVTLQPAISSKAKEIGRSYLHMINDDDPSQYLRWLKEKEKKLEEKRDLERKRKEEEELVGCTFAPRTIDCPAYIKRIKNSMDLVKAARSADSVMNSQAIKPDWR